MPWSPASHRAARGCAGRETPDLGASPVDPPRGFCGGACAGPHMPSGPCDSSHLQLGVMSPPRGGLGQSGCSEGACCVSDSLGAPFSHLVSPDVRPTPGLCTCCPFARNSLTIFLAKWPSPLHRPDPRGLAISVSSRASALPGLPGDRAAPGCVNNGGNHVPAERQHCRRCP